MKEPKPLLREGASDFERQLLGAAMRERPSTQLRSRMRRTLGLTGPLAWASSVKAMLLGLSGKSAVAVAVVGLVAAGVGVRSLPADRLPAEQDDGRASVARDAPVVANERVPTAAPAAKPVALPLPEKPLPEKSAKAPDQSVSSGELREEILLLDQARTALQHGSGAAALEQLDRYRQRFPSGILSREAVLLRQQAAASRRASSTAH